MCVFFFTKKTELGLKLKQGKTRKRSAVSCSPSFSQFPVEGGHFVTQLGGEHNKLWHCFCFFSPTAREFHNQVWTFSPAEQLLWTREREVKTGREWRRKSSRSVCFVHGSSYIHYLCLSCLDNKRTLTTRESAKVGLKGRKATASWIRISSLILWEGVDTGHGGTGTLLIVCVCVFQCVYPSLLP